jgi:type IV secretory pathway ATPase VirB11/archaellum biosynthesis ATPase
MVRRESTPQQRKPPDLPPDWLHVWNEIDSHSDEWGRRAALFVGAYRLTTGQGPTFAELFAELTPELAILRFKPEQNFKQRHAVRNRFMVEVVNLFARRQWTHFSRESRSLKLGSKGHQLQHSDFRTYSAQFVTQRHWSVNIRKFTRRIRDLGTLAETGSLSHLAAEFLRMSVLAGSNILVSGATQSGKTTMLGALLSASRPSERIVTVEETFELDLSAPDHVAMQCRQPSLEGSGEITLRRLIKEALRMRPDRIVVGEVREAESLDLLIALNSGLPGMSSIHANSARDALVKLSTLPLLVGRNIDSSFVVPTVASTIDLVVHCELLRSGARRVVEIVAPTGRVSADGIEVATVFRRDRGELIAAGVALERTIKFDRAGFDPAGLLSAGVA